MWAVDLSTIDKHVLNEYCQIFLPKIRRHIKSIKFDDKNIHRIIPISTTYPNMCSLSITDIGIGGKYLSYLELFKQLVSLELHFDRQQCDENIPNDVYSNLFRSNSQLQILLLNNICITINDKSIHPCFIKKLRIDLRSLYDLFILLNNLPSIEYVNVGIRNVIERHNDKNFKKFSSLSRLKEFIFFTIQIVNYRSLELLLSQCSALEHLSLDLDSTQFIDGYRLETKLLAKLSKLKRFHFCLRILNPYLMNIDNYVETFKSSYWLNHPILCFKIVLRRSYYCVFSLPFAFHHFLSLSSNITNYRSNIDDISICSKQNKLKEIGLYDTYEPFSLGTFQFIKQTFPLNVDLEDIKSLFPNAKIMQ
ncbi:unnamed protein product [Didymodactylos carnosus]|uniref:Uncharacterized protein n=1 Tax=Didymodactylos carnosus TaxID=1234261 RepID=A0A814PPK6_9BILA|nr:unnamed protein product [Didymodactylos carnosus]CAF3873317.1 unnamed protein product [Didymodactylos carnosus]